MNCINLKQKFNKKFECKITKKEITLSECQNCTFKERKPPKESNYTKINKSLSKGLKTYSKFVNKTPMKKVSKKQAKLEKERFSIIYQDLTKCCVEGCNSTYNVSKNEVFEGAYRLLSIKYGMVCSFCENHHRKFHNDRAFNLKYKVMFQKEFVKRYGYDKFMEVFKIDYEYLYAQKKN